MHPVGTGIPLITAPLLNRAREIRFCVLVVPQRKITLPAAVTIPPLTSMQIKIVGNMFAAHPSPGWITTLNP
jgi:hypothetical protein